MKIQKETSSYWGLEKQWWKCISWMGWWCWYWSRARRCNSY